jgi:hypothetical protein
MKKSVLLQNGLMNFSFVKKAMLVMAMGAMGLAASAQTSLNTIPYSDGKLYPFVSPINVAGGATIAIGSNSTYVATDHWDLSAYTGIEFKVTFPADANGTVQMRLVIVGTDGGATSVQKSVTAVPNTSTVISFDFAADGAQTKKLWSIKLGWSTSASPAYSLTIDHINVLGTSTSVSANQMNEDPNRLVDVYSMTGKLVRSKVKYAEATNGLEKGLYIVDNKKVVVTK